MCVFFSTCVKYHPPWVENAKMSRLLMILKNDIATKMIKYFLKGSVSSGIYFRYLMVKVWSFTLVTGSQEMPHLTWHCLQTLVSSESSWSLTPVRRMLASLLSTQLTVLSCSLVLVPSAPVRTQHLALWSSSHVRWARCLPLECLRSGPGVRWVDSGHSLTFLPVKRSTVVLCHKLIMVLLWKPPMSPTEVLPTINVMLDSPSQVETFLKALCVWIMVSGVLDPTVKVRQSKISLLAIWLPFK